MPAGHPAFAGAFGTSLPLAGTPPLCADLWRCPSHLSPEVLAPAGFCCPCLRRLATSSASLETSDPFPSSAGYSASLWHSRTFLPGLHTFRPFATVLSRIAVCSFRRESGTCTPPFFRTSAGHRVEGTHPWQLQYSHQSASCGDPMSTARSFALATALLVACLLG